MSDEKRKHNWQQTHHGAMYLECVICHERWNTERLVNYLQSKTEGEHLAFTAVQEENDRLKEQMAQQRKALEWMKQTGDYFRYKPPEQIDACKLVSAMYATAEDALSVTSADIRELVKFAELGRLAIEAIDAYTPTVYDSKPCEGSYNSLGNGEVCGHCNWLVFCQKRAELLTEVVQ